MTFDSDKFAKLIISECERQVALTQQQPVQINSNVSAYKAGKNAMSTVQLGTMLVGVFVLLAACILLFDGVMVPAMWQLTSVIWIMWQMFKSRPNQR